MSKEIKIPKGTLNVIFKSGKVINFDAETVYKPGAHDKTFEFKKDGKTVAEFDRSDFCGWWVE